jgi:hypothetical protein
MGDPKTKKTTYKLCGRINFKWIVLSLKLNNTLKELQDRTNLN